MAAIHSEWTRDPDDMTVPAQWYMYVTALQHGLLAWAFFFIPSTFQSTTYHAARALFPFQVWAVVFLIGSVIALYAGFSRQERVARLALLVSTFITALWAGTFIAALILGYLTGPTGLIAWICLVLKDLIVSRNPLRLPLERLLRPLRGEQSAGSVDGGWD